MNISLILLTLLLTAAATHNAARAQSAEDAVELRYRFVPGQEIAYRVLSYDSIVVYDTVWHTLARERSERIVFRCDSVRPDGYVMSMTMSEYSATERRGKSKPRQLSTHEWVGRTVTFLMDSLGRRVDLLRDSPTPASSPGGPFAPMLLPHFGPGAAYVGSKQQFVNEQWLTDNLHPPIRWRGNCLQSVAERVDTLREKTVRVEISEVGASNYRQGGPGAPLTRATINGAGTYYVAPSLGYPVGGGYQLINRFTLELAGGKSVDGRHMTGMSYEIERPRKGAPGKPRRSRRR